MPLEKYIEVPPTNPSMYSSSRNMDMHSAEMSLVNSSGIPQKSINTQTWSDSLEMYAEKEEMKKNKCPYDLKYSFSDHHASV